MKNLAKHIELLLRDNDCVILPGFGGFIAHAVPAYYVSEEHLYYPPSRSISFNTAITMNDGLLAQSYMKSYNVDYAQAVYLIDVAIEKMRDTLDEEGSVTIPHIGTIKQDIHQTVQFIAEPAGISSPLHFGLGTLAISTLAQLQALPGNTTPKKEAIITQTERTIDLHIQKRALRQILSTAAVFLLLLMAALPVGDLKPTDIASLQITNIISEPQTDMLPTDQIVTMEEPQEIVESIEAKDEQESTENIEAQSTKEAIIEAITEPTKEPVAEENHTTIIKEEISETPTEEVSETNVELASEATTPIVTETPVTTTTPEETLQPATDNKTYHIIVASLPNRRGAEEVIEGYVAKGFEKASLVERDNRVRISLVQFTDKDEANNYLKTLRENEAFRNAWLLPVRN